MPAGTTQGQGVGTQRKQELFYHANAVGMRIVAKHPKLSRYPFWLFDGNCGSGWNDEVNVIGSPITAHLAADYVGLTVDRRRFHFCDRDRESMLRLQARLANDPAWEAASYLSIGDNEEGLELFAQCITAQEKSAYALGAVIIDPNGWFYRNANSDGPPTEGLRLFARRFPRIDVVLNLNVRTYQLCKGQSIDVPSPIDVLRSLTRQHWLVGWIKMGNSRFLVAVGRNLETGDHRKVGLHHLDSEEGRVIMSFAEGGRQGDLLDAPPITALSNISGVSSPSCVSGGAGSGLGASAGIVPLRRPGD